MDNTTYIPNEVADLFPNEAAKIVSIVTLAVIIFLTVVGNLLVIFSVIVFTRLQTVTNYFVTSLAVADFLVGAVVLPFSTAYIYVQEWFYGVTWCNLWVSIDVCVCTASVLNLFAIAVDRYIAITSPFQYHIRMSSRNAAVAIAFIWVASIMMSVFPIMTGLNTNDYNIQNMDTPNACGFETNPYYTVIVGILAFWVPLIGMCLVYLSLFRTASTQARRIAAMDKAVAASNPHGAGNPSQAKRERKAAKTLGIIMGCFLVCWGPYIVYWTLSDVCKITVSYDGLNAMTWMGYLNSTLNPLIYAFFNREFRRAFQKLLLCGKCQQLPSKWKDTVLHEPTQISNVAVPMHIPVSDA